MNHIKAENFMRSAKAPTIRAGVMMAKVIWKVMKTDSGIVWVPKIEVRLIPFRNRWSKPPIQAFSAPPLPKVRL